MQHGIGAILAAVGCLLTLATGARADVTITKTEYKGWADAYRMTNGTVEIVVVPSVGRVMRYGFVGGANMLWENPAVAGKLIPAGQWPNTGGDKIWPWPQDDWGKLFPNAWPPPPNADQNPHTVEVIGKKILRLTSGVIAPWGFRIVRDIRLAPTGTNVSFTNRFEKVTDGGETRPVGVWTITQVPATAWVIARLTPNAHLARSARDPTPNTLPYKSMSGDAAFKSVKLLPGNVLFVERNGATATKIGTDGDTLATLQGDTVFTVRSAAKPPADNKGGAYEPSERLQFYSHPDNSGVPPYIEMEMTSPQKSLKAKGDTLTLQSEWELKRLPDGKRDPAGVAAVINAG